MKIIKVIFFSALACVVLNYGCNSNKVSDDFHMEKKFWDVADYEAAISGIQFHTAKEEKFPNYSDPLKAPIFAKMVDINNLSVVLEDTTLGASHREKFSQKMFDHIRNIENIYEVVDRQDKFIYPMELVELYRFNFQLQLYYFKVGNEEMIKNAVDPNDANTRDIAKRNEQTAVNNYEIYISELRREDSYSTDALTRYAEVINEYYPKLIAEFPNANYSEMVEKINTIEKKLKSEEIKKALDNIKGIIEKKNIEKAQADSLLKAQTIPVIPK